MGRRVEQPQGLAALLGQRRLTAASATPADHHQAGRDTQQEQARQGGAGTRCGQRAVIVVVADATAATSGTTVARPVVLAATRGLAVLVPVAVLGHVVEQ